ncbi:MAG: adenylate/guanylate cyclase domain-containing protein [Planctomycetales bacterium]|nr:adenylate/guanylate cyclase domain-containing protein [Planctomycetales bacterium]
MTREEFYRRLDQRGGDSAAIAAFDRALWADVGQRRAVLVTDLSGFTRITKARGILHFLTVFRRCVALASPEIAAAGGTLVKTAADNLLAVFAEPAQALAAARGMIARAAAANAPLEPDAHVRICAGVGYGDILLLEDDLFGDEVNVAYKLGEDVARPDEILISEPAVARLRERGEAPELRGPVDEAVGSASLTFYRAATEGEAPARAASRPRPAGRKRARRARR